MNRTLIREMAADPAVFRQHVIVETDQGPRRLAEIISPWQRQDFESLDSGWRRAAGHEVEGGCSRGWLERPRGCSKTGDIALSVAWCLAFAPRQVNGCAAAADRGQAALLKASMARLIRHNEWLGQLLEIQSHRVINRRTESQLEVMASDVSTSYGQLPNFVVCDELAHWSRAELWESLFSSAAKRADCCLMVIGNAGFKETWQWPLREQIRNDPSWYFHHLPGGTQTWIDPAALAEQERLLPPRAFKRLWLNEWAEGGGDALDPADVLACVDSQLSPMAGRQRGMRFVAGLDLGLKHDHSALVIVGCDRKSQRLRLAEARRWAPVGGQVDLQEVEQQVEELARRYKATIYYDPHQAGLMSQRLTRAGCKLHEMPFAGKNLTTMATTLLDVFRSRRIGLYHDSRLISDLKKLSIVEKSFGFKLQAPKDGMGHADTAFALAICLPAALAALKKRGLYVGGTMRKAEKQRGMLSSGHGAGPLSETVKSELEKRSIQRLERMGFRRVRTASDDARRAGPWDPRLM